MLGSLVIIRSPGPITHPNPKIPVFVQLHLTRIQTRKPKMSVFLYWKPETQPESEKFAKPDLYLKLNNPNKPKTKKCQFFLF